MAQDITAWKSRKYRGYREPEIVETDEFEQIADSVFTYNPDGTVATLTKTRLLPDGATIQAKNYVFTYNPDGTVSTITQTIT
jgi:hypothetical protein